MMLTTLQPKRPGDDAKKIILNHPLPKARQRTNVVSDDYIPEGIRGLQGWKAVD